MLDLHRALTAQTVLRVGKLSHEIREHPRSRDVSPRNQLWCWPSHTELADGPGTGLERELKFRVLANRAAVTLTLDLSLFLRF